jgi:hypothetical protein
VRIRRSVGVRRHARGRGHSSFDPARYVDDADWQDRVRGSDVRLQWDPDHDPGGQPLERRAVQLGLRGAHLRAYATEAVAISDVSAFVEAQRGRRADLLLPVERVYPVRDPAVVRHLGRDVPPGG